MGRNWTFGQKLGAGFAVTVLLTVLIGVIAVYALRTVVTQKDRVIDVDAQLLVDAEKLRAQVERKGGESRAFLLTRETPLLESMRSARADLIRTLERLKHAVYTDEGRRLLAAIEALEHEHQESLDAVVAMRVRDEPIEAIVRGFDERVKPKRDLLDRQISAFVERERALLSEASQAASEGSASAISLVVAITAGVALLSALLAFVLTSVLGRQIGGAVGQVQSSSAELQATANQQATGAREQATAMTEITTTINELLATSRQIAESAQRVAGVADETLRAARAGDTTVERGHESIAGIRRQVDLVVSHILDLGKKSQHVGAVLDIVSELAEQTNILAINATIEAAGAGEAGRRFAVVADEIRKLADRVAGSTKEIRALIDEVRSAVNTTVMATETGSKAVDVGSKQFGEVAASFKHIAGLVITTSEAAREIELSTKQQATAVEQVNVAIANVAQATKETEVSSGQTLQTASQLAGISRDLLRLVEPQAA